MAVERGRNGLIPDREESMGGRRYPAGPVLGVGALIFEDARVLLVKRGKEPLRGYWSLPGGGVEVGEALEAAVRREVQEETGLEVAVGPIATVFERILSDASGACEYHYVLIDFYCTVTGGNLHPGSDASCVEWFDVTSLHGLPMTQGTREVVEACSKAGGRSQLFVTRP